MTYRLTGIVLRRRALREADRLYTVYTRERGKVELLAQGTRKIRSKLAGTLETIAVLAVQAARGRVFDRLATAEVVESFPDIRSAPQIASALAAFALADDIVRGAEREEPLFDLLRDACRAIGAADGPVALEGILDAFLWKLLPILGYKPELGRCLRCERPGDPAGFDVRGGGMLCGACFAAAASEGKAVPVSPATVGALRTIIGESFHASIPEKAVLPVRRLGFLYLAMHGERPWPGRNVATAMAGDALDIPVPVR